MLTVGSKLGPYEIVAAAGAGGMGEVYRARDSRLGRDVAIKILPEHLASDPSLRERFEREARAISQLSHPHICTLHDIGREGGTDFLVLEYLEGETLEKRLTRGPLPPEQVLKTATQIADALDKAHQRGIIHRDLKPGNIILTKSGAKLLDFGLARQTEQAPVATALTEMTAVSRKLTSEGSLLGTFQYMAPEQLEGQDADARTDIFALGVVIYEMATGKPAFNGRTKASLIASILSSEPPAIMTVQPMTPPALDRVVHTCLAKAPEDRFQSVHDLKLQLEWIAEAGSQAGVPAPVASRRRRREWMSVGAIAVLVIVAAVLGWWGYTQHEQLVDAPPVHAIIPEPEKAHFYFVGDTGGPPVLSPDGRSLAFVASDGAGRQMLWLRPLAKDAAEPIAGTEGATFPFWSPDSQSLCFFADAKLKRVDLSGATLILANAGNGRGGAWSPDGTIVFSPEFRAGLKKVPASGGKPEDLYPLTSEFTSYRWPQFLPDGKHFLFLAVSHQAGSDQDGTVFIGSADGSALKAITHGNTAPHYASGYLLLTQSSALLAQPFDPTAGKVTGEPRMVADHVLRDGGVWRDVYDVSKNGILVYQTGSSEVSNHVAWIDRTGRVLRDVELALGYQTLQLSPDGTHLALQGNPGLEIWNYDLERGTRTRITFDPAQHLFPIWSPDGKTITYVTVGSNAGTQFYSINRRSAGGTGNDEVLVRSATTPTVPESWSPDGKLLVYQKGFPGQNGQELWIHSMADGSDRLLMKSQFVINFATISPNGKWIAYDTNETGRAEVYVSPFPNVNDGRWQVSVNGGYSAAWTRDGKEIFFETGGNAAISVAEYRVDGKNFSASTPRELVRLNASTIAPVYGVSPDAKRLLVPHNPNANVAPLTLIVNWPAELKK